MRLDGSTPTGQRQNIVDHFNDQTSDYCAYLCLCVVAMCVPDLIPCLRVIHGISCFLALKQSGQRGVQPRGIEPHCLVRSGLVRTLLRRDCAARVCSLLVRAPALALHRNPANDAQAMGRVWRYGQKKKCWIYRFASYILSRVFWLLIAILMSCLTLILVCLSTCQDWDDRR